MDAVEIVFLLLAGFAAGAINGVVGGGTLVSFPALLAAGYPAKVANVTNAVAIWPGYVGGTYGYREELQGQRKRAVLLAVPAALGALLGAAILLATSEDTFEDIVPFLVLIAVGLMVFQGPIGRFAEHHRVRSRGGDHVPVALHGSTFLTGVYGAYFGAGLGIMNLAILTILLPDDLHRSNALRAVLSLLVNGIAAISFALFGPVEWLAALAMAVGALAGGYLGVGVARALGPVWLRWAVIALGLASAIALFVQ
jgi:uncharacterized membrane protein YfcA